jgi:hypothetical protein
MMSGLFDKESAANQHGDAGSDPDGNRVHLTLLGGTIWTLLGGRFSLEATLLPSVGITIHRYAWVVCLYACIYE